MKTTKRILAGVLMVCMLLSMMIPAAFAADPTVTANNGVLEYLFGFSDGVTSRQQNENAVKERAFATADEENGQTLASSYLSTSRADRGYDCSTGHIQFRAGATGVWYAIKIKVPSANTYDMIFTVGAASTGGVSNVFVVDSDKYTEALAQTPAVAAETYATIAAKLAAAQKLDAADNEKIFNYLNTTSVGSVDSYSSAVSEQNIGSVSFTKAGDYICLFVSSKKSDLNTEGKSSDLQLALKKLSLTPVVNSTEVKTAEELKSALSAAESDSTIVLSNAITVEEALTVPEGVTLNLNSYNLTAPSVNASAAGAQIIDSSDGNSILTVAKEELSGNGDNGGYMPLYDSTGYRFYKVAMNSIGADTSVANAAKLRFQVKFDNADAYALILKGTTGVSIKGTFGGSVESTGTFTYADETDFAAAWATAANAKAGKVAIVVNLSGLDAVDTLTLTPSVYNAGVSISGTALTAKG